MKHTLQATATPAILKVHAALFYLVLQPEAGSWQPLLSSLRLKHSMNAGERWWMAFAAALP